MQKIHLVALVLACTVLQAQDLGLGAAAPKIEVSEFVKGEPITEFAVGTPYVVEFWATWCPPCKATIPHLTELAKKYPAAKFLGVSVWEQDTAAVKPFVAEMGDKMDYTVAIDQKIDGEEQGAMAKSWMTAAGEGGIPTAFIVNQEGKIAWIGHPMGMEDALSKIVAKTWDLDAEIAKVAASKARETKAAALDEQLSDEKVSLDDKIKAVRAWFVEDPEAEASYWPMLWHQLLAKDDDTDADAYLRSRMGAIGDDADELASLAWTLLSQDQLSDGTKKVAVEAAEKADRLAEGKDAMAAALLTYAYLQNKQGPEAIKAGERALTLTDDENLKSDLTQMISDARELAAN